jgi:hypothetical protein
LVIIGLKSARRRIALGIGEAGKPMSEGTAYKKLQALAAKGCLTILASTTSGTRMAVKLPREIEGLIAPAPSLLAIKLEDLDFFEEDPLRACIVKREKQLCFYCLRKLSTDDWVIEHVISRPKGDNTYRNVVAACRSCNNRKGPTAAREFVRLLYRDCLINADELGARMMALDALERGELRPEVPSDDLPPTIPGTT